MKEQFIQYNQEHKLINHDDIILVAVSGGIDSCALLNLLYNLQYNCIVAHCNFKLRDKDSDDDEQFVKDLAAKYNYDFRSRSFNTSQFAEDNGISIQMAARELRYSYFHDLLKKHSCSVIATAHHGDDNIETFFINLLHGTGLKGLGGIPLKSGNIVRPLLFANRTQIDIYAQQNKLTWRNDISNFSNKYTRNKIRNEIIPLFDEIKPGYRKIMQRNIEYLKDSDALLNELLAERIRSIITTRDNVIYISIQELLKWDSGKTILFHIISPFGFDPKQTEKIWSCIYNNPGKMFYSKTHKLNKDRDNLIISEIENIYQNRKFYIDEEVEFINEPFELSLEKLPWKSGDPISKEQKTIMVDADSITFPLIIRRWQPGDYFQPFGMQGIKKVSNFFIDEKIPVTEKKNTWIIESSNRIIWIVGHRSDERFKISANTQRIIKLQVL